MRVLVGTALALSAASVCTAQPPETKRAAAGQEFGVLNYIIDRSVPQVISAKLQDMKGKVIGTYILDDRTSDERLEKLAFGRRRGSYAVTHHSNNDGTEIWFRLRDEVGGEIEEAKATFDLQQRAWSVEPNQAAFDQLVERRKRDQELIVAINTDLCIPPKGQGAVPSADTYTERIPICDREAGESYLGLTICTSSF